MEQLTVVKIGGNVTDEPNALSGFLQRFAALPGYKILVHGGGKTTTALCKRLNLPQTMIEGRRLTTPETLDVAIMVYAGLVNKKIVSGLQNAGCDAIGLSGADAAVIKSTRRCRIPIDYGWVGDIEPSSVSTTRLSQLLGLGLTPVLCAITQSEGGLLNTNADTVASMLAIALCQQYEVQLMYCFEKKGVLSDPSNDESVIDLLTQAMVTDLRAKGAVQGGMIPKLDAAFRTLSSGVSSVRICHAQNILEEKKGTILAHA